MNRNRAAAVCISLANLCHLGAWSAAFSADYRFYLRDSGGLNTALLSLLASIGAMSIVGFVIFLAARTHALVASAARWGAFVVLTIPVWTAIGWMVPGIAQNSAPAYLLGELLVLLAIGYLWQRFARFRHDSYLVVALAIFALPLFAVQGFRLAARLPHSTLRTAGMVNIDSSQQPLQTLGLEAAPRRQRVIWLLFDELDQYMTFEGGTAFAEFRRLRETSFHAGNAVAANYVTAAAVPSMFLGSAVSLESSTALNSRDWTSPGSLFSLLPQKGKTSAILGWYLPYCTLLGAELNNCYSVLETVASLPGVTWTTRTLRQWREIGRSIPLCATSYRFLHGALFPGTVLPSLDAGMHRSAYDLIYTRLPEFLTGPYDVVYIHLPVPHPPGIFRTSDSAAAGGDYLDNLRVADQTLGYIRQTLERANLWDSSTIVLTGDHHFRTKLWKSTERVSPRVDQLTGGREHQRVPLLVKMPGQTESIAYDKPFSLLLMRDLMLELADGKFGNPVAVARWLDANRARFPDLTVPGSMRAQ